MGRKGKHQWLKLPAMLKEYAETRTMYFARYSPYHMRLSDDYTTLDIWTSAHYWVGKTDYFEQTDKRIVERAGEKGDFDFNPHHRDSLYEWLDNLFYAADMLEEEE